MFKFLCLLVVVTASIENANAVLGNDMGADQYTKKVKLENTQAYNLPNDPTQTQTSSFLSPCSSPTPFNSTATTPQMSPVSACDQVHNWSSESKNIAHLIVWSTQITFDK